MLSQQHQLNRADINRELRGPLLVLALVLPVLAFTGLTLYVIVSLTTITAGAGVFGFLQARTSRRVVRPQLRR